MQYYFGLRSDLVFLAESAPDPGKYFFPDPHPSAIYTQKITNAFTKSILGEKIDILNCLNEPVGYRL